MKNDKYLTEVIKTYNSALTPKLLLYHMDKIDLYNIINDSNMNIVESNTENIFNQRETFTTIILSENDIHHLKNFISLLDDNGFVIVIRKNGTADLEQYIMSTGLITYNHQDTYFVGIKSNKNSISNHLSMQASVYDDYVEGYNDDIGFLQKYVCHKNDILEIGIGTGRLALTLSHNKNSYYGIDYSPSMLKILEEKSKLLTLPITYYYQNMLDFNLDKLFDIILYPYRVLPYCKSRDDIVKTLLCAKKHLKSTDSRILINMLNFSNAYIQKWNNKNYEYEFKRYTGELWRKVDYMHFDISKNIMYRNIKILNERDELVINTDDNLLWLTADELCSICKKSGFKIYDIWPAYEYTTYHGEMEYLISIGLNE